VVYRAANTKPLPAHSGSGQGGRVFRPSQDAVLQLLSGTCRLTWGRQLALKTTYQVRRFCDLYTVLPPLIGSARVKHRPIRGDPIDHLDCTTSLDRLSSRRIHSPLIWTVAYRRAPRGYDICTLRVRCKRARRMRHFQRMPCSPGYGTTADNARVQFSSTLTTEFCSRPRICYNLSSLIAG